MVWESGVLVAADARDEEVRFQDGLLRVTLLFT